MMMLKMMHKVMLRMEETRRIRMKQRAAKWKEQVGRNVALWSKISNCGKKSQIVVKNLKLWSMMSFCGKKNTVVMIMKTSIS